MREVPRVSERRRGPSPGPPSLEPLPGAQEAASLYPSEALLPGGSSPDPLRPAVTVGLTVPMHGAAGMFGLSCLSCAVLAAEEINADGGLLGRPVRLVAIDGAGAPSAVADRIEHLVRTGTIDVVAGWHLSHVRRAVAARMPEVPYIYSALYEGGERAPGVVLIGETPDRQIAPTLAWFRREMGISRWAIVGDDYLWPRGSIAAVRSFVGQLEVEIVDEVLVPLGTSDFTDVLTRLRRGRAEAVLMLLVGEDAVHFNRAFAAAGLDTTTTRLSPLMDENMLLASGPAATGGLYSASAYFSGLVTADALDLLGRYTERFGPEAPVLNSMGESCYEALRLLASVTDKARSLEGRRLLAAADDQVGYQGPRGSVHLADRHLVQDVYLARADGLDFDVVAEL